MSNEGNQRSKGKKVKFKILSLGGVIYVFWSYFRQVRKKDQRTLFERPKQDKSLQSEKCRNPCRQRKQWPFGAFITVKLSRFIKMRLEMLHTYSSASVLIHMFRLFNSKTSLEIFGKTRIFEYYSFQFSKYSKSDVEV